jgi:eukaryotic-like serine/threonine-protein kinase
VDEESIQPKGPLRVIGRYALYDPIAAGGMATVHLGRLLGPVGFSRTVAIKRSHPEMAADPEFVSMFLDEARLAARIRHPNVVSTLDVVALEGELFLVMDFVQGESLSKLMRASKLLEQKIPPEIACTIMAGALHGLHAAHEAKSERGVPLNIVHRDVSPQNILVGIDGIARVLDFGVAKAAGRVATTREGQIKGKLAYLAPEQLSGDNSRLSDIYSASVVLWEALTGERLFQADNPGELLNLVLYRKVQAPGELVKGLAPGLDEIVLKGLSRDPKQRFATAREMAVELERKGGQVSAVEVGEWVERVAKDAIATRTKKVAEIENYAPNDLGEETTGSPRRAGAEEAAAIAAARQRGDIPYNTTTTFPELPHRARHPSSSELGSAPTQSSMASISAYPPTDSRSGRARLGIAAGTFALLLLVVTTAVLLSKPVRKESATTATVASTASSVGPPAPLPAASADTPSVTEPAAQPDAGAMAATVPKPKPAQRAVPKKQAPDCSFPYIVDAKGIKHIRPECLH